VVTVCNTYTAYFELAKVLIPLGVIIGSILSRNFSEYTNVMMEVINITLACILISVSGMHMAMAIYLKYLRDKYNMLVII